MAIYKDPRTIKKISIPSIPDSEIEIYNTLLWKDVEEVMGESDVSVLSRGKEILKRLIKDWNLTDENGNKLPITTETLDSFTMDMINYLLAQTDYAPKSEKGEELKKK